jgi:hypothetical protein
MNLASTAVPGRMTHSNRIRQPDTALRPVRPRTSSLSSNRRTRDRVSSDAVVSAYIHDIAQRRPHAALAHAGDGLATGAEEALAA